MSADNDFVVVANRLPVDLVTNSDGTQDWNPSPGGLVAALSPVLQSEEGCWVGWPGVADAEMEPFHTDGGVLLHPVTLTQHDFESFYEGFCNATVWPLFHDLIVPPVYNREWWHSYRDVNERFAEEVVKVAAQGATVWVQDYQLMLLPGILRQRRPDLKIGFFLHIPFPAADLYRQLPWREEIIRGLLGADLIGFHIEPYVANFLNLMKDIAPAGSHIGQPDFYSVEGNPATREAGARIIAADGHKVEVSAFPISIDPASVGKADPEAVAELRHDLGDPETVLLGVDRLDYTKGILQRLVAIEELFEAGALDPENTTFVQVATPSRERLTHYRRARSQVEEAVGRINGRFAPAGRAVVHYYHRSLPKSDLSNFYSLADVMVVTPFKDGMNLVAKEYVSCHGDGTGSLVLSEFAGAAFELPEANLCNPFDIDSTKRAILTAVRSLKYEPELMERRMRTMHRQVQVHDVALWARSFRDTLR